MYDLLPSGLGFFAFGLVHVVFFFSLVCLALAIAGVIAAFTPSARPAGRIVGRGTAIVCILVLMLLALFARLRPEHPDFLAVFFEADDGAQVARLGAWCFALPTTIACVAALKRGGDGKSRVYDWGLAATGLVALAMAFVSAHVR